VYQIRKKELKEKNHAMKTKNLPEICSRERIDNKMGEKESPNRYEKE